MTNYTEIISDLNLDEIDINNFYLSSQNVMDENIQINIFRRTGRDKQNKVITHTTQNVTRIISSVQPKLNGYQLKSNYGLIDQKV